MNILERYIASAVFLYTLIVTFVLLGLYFFTTLAGEAGRVGQGSYSIFNAIVYSLMLIPRQIHELFPMSALLGSMLGLSGLAKSSELTVMRAAGISVQGIAIAVIKAGVIMVFVVALISEFVAPELEKIAHFQRMQAIDRGISFRTSNGLWVRDGNAFLTMEKLLPTGEAREITKYIVDGDRLTQIMHAKRGQHSPDGWEVEDVTITYFEQSRINVTHEQQQLWQTRLTQGVIDSAAISPDKLSIRELIEFIGYLRDNDLASHRYEIAMWMRFFIPLATGGMLLLALPFVFGNGRNMETDRRILLGVLIGISFYLFNGIFSRIGIVYNMSPFVSAATPAMLVYLLWYTLMRRVK